MTWLSSEAENSLKMEVLDAVSKYLEACDKPSQRATGLLPASQVMEELDVKYKTLQRWENAGLKRYTPPLEDTRKVYYKVSDILKFMGVEDG